MNKNYKTIIFTKEWLEDRKKAMFIIRKMKKRQMELPFEIVFKEAMEQSKRIRFERKNNL